MATLCYTPLYVPFSFKGAPALATEFDYEGGRRGAEAEFPFAEHTAYADLGRRIRLFSIRGVFRENSHLADARRFFAVCESPGPGILVHPAYGAIRAACKRIRIEDSSEASQGETRFSAEFVEANASIVGLVSSLLGGLSLGAITAAISDYFAAGYQPAAASLFARLPITMVAGAAIGEIKENLLLSAGSRDDDVRFWRVVHDLDQIGNNHEHLLSTSTTWLAISGGLSAISIYGIDPNQRINAFRSIANAAIAIASTQLSGREAQEVIVATVRILAAANMAKATLELPLKTMQDGFATYDRIMTVLDGETTIARAACNDNLYIVLREFTGSVQAALLNQIYRLPAVVQYNFHGGVASLTAAYEIYGDARKFRTIEQFNPLANPLMVGPLVSAPRAESEESALGRPASF